MSIIKVEEISDKYYVSFNGKRNQFNDYINIVMAMPKKEYDFENKRWIFDKKEIQKIKAIFKYEEEKKKPDVIKNNEYGKKNISGYQDIGKSMKLTPFDYQKEAIKFGLEAKEILIVYPCGSGKTPIGIGIYLEAKERGLLKGKGMIVVKASLKTQWKIEIEKFSNLKAEVIKTPSEIAASPVRKIRARKNKINKLDKIADIEKIKKIKLEIKELELEAKNLFREQFEGQDLYVLNYETLKDQEVKNQLHKRKLDYIMADEIHYVKNRTSDRSKALYEFGDVPFKIGATATPVGKNPEDLYGIFKFVNPKIFPEWSKFARNYIKYAGYGKIAGFRNLDKLKKEISPSVIVKLKEEISDQLPSLMVMQRYSELEPAQARMNEKLMEELEELKDKEFKIRQGIKSEKDAKNNEELMKIEAAILGCQTYAQQLANTEELLKMSSSDTPKKYLTGSKSNKLEMLTDLVEEILSSGEKVTIFSRFKKMQDVITNIFAKEFPEAKIAYISGSLSANRRYEEAYTKFRDNDDYKILLSTDAGAEGLNLSKCKYLIEYDLAPSYAIQTQRHGRVERADSKHESVFVYQLIAKDSWDEIAMKIIEKKEGYDAEIIKSIAE